jgi:2'-5' RNA ligase
MIRYGIYLTFDRATETALLSLRKELANRFANHIKLAKMPPHLTLLVFDEMDESATVERFKQCVRSIESFDLMLNDIGLFRKQRAILYIKPILSNNLQHSYQCCFDHFLKSAIVPEYQDSRLWTPHVTLVKIDHQYSNEGIALVEQQWQARPAIIDSIGLINVRQPLQVLASKQLNR